MDRDFLATTDSDFADSPCPDWLAKSPQVKLIRHLPAKDGVTDDWPSWLPGDAIELIRKSGIEYPWVHQCQLAELAFGKKHCAITTGTGSGKTLSYLMPVLAATGFDIAPAPKRNPADQSIQSTGATSATTLPCAIYLAPTKALANDQLKVCKQLGLRSWMVTTVDGDSSLDQRDAAQKYGRFLLTNPDMLHYSILPNHKDWVRLFSSLEFVVVDEAHQYRGVWGAQVGLVIRRLRRICNFYGSDPTFILASATASNPAIFGASLICEDDISVVSKDTSASAGRTVVFWQPEKSLYQDSATLLGRLARDQIQTLAFIPSRAMAEQVSIMARKESGVSQISAYRSGYLASERRELEAGLASRKILGLASTNALELGIDIAGLDAVLIAGYPATLASFWQQAGRAGRRNRPGLVVFLAAANPLDHYLFAHPELIFDAPIDQSVIYPNNPYIMGPHLAAAAQSCPLTEADSRWFGDDFEAVCEILASQNVLRKRPNGWFWPHPTKASQLIDLRSTAKRNVEIIEIDTGRVIGEVDQSAADRTLHPEAIYLHQGEHFAVEHYSPRQHQAFVSKIPPSYTTQPLSDSQITIIKQRGEKPLHNTTVCWGEIELASQVTGFLTRNIQTGEVLGYTDLDMPVRKMKTHSMWVLLPDDLVAASGLTSANVGEAAHGAEHCAISMLSMFTPCDRWDIGGLSTNCHLDTQMATIFVHDGSPGGAGFAYEGFKLAEPWWAATLDRLASCSCESGCPACIVSPKCGNANQHLSKTGAFNLLRTLLGIEN